MKRTNKHRLCVNKLQEALFKKLGIRLRDSVSGFRGYNRYFAEEFLKISKSKGFGIATEEVVVAYLINSIIKKVNLSYAKPRSEFTKSFKLIEVIDGFLCHKDELINKGFYQIVNFLTFIREQIHKKQSCFEIDLSVIDLNVKMIVNIKNNECTISEELK